MEQPQKTLLLGNNPKTKTPSITAMEKCTKRRGSRKCLFCNLRYTSSICLRKHICTTHKGKRRYSCNFCCRTFFFSASLQRHHQLHKKMALLKKSRKNRDNTRGNRKNKDRIALKKRKKKEKLIPKVFKCHQCAYSANTVSNLQVHFSVHTGEKPFRCQECDKSFRSSSHLKRHNLTHMRKHCKCNSCLFIGCTVEELKVHQRTCYSEDPIREQLWSSPSRCAITKVQANMPEQKESTSLPKGINLQIYKCEQCDYATHMLTRLNHHRKIHSGEKPYCCDVCEKKFRMSSHLKRHKFLHQNLDFQGKSHTHDRPSSSGCEISRPVSKTYICDYCDFVFHREEHLQYHKAVHFQDQPHENMTDEDLEEGAMLPVGQPSHGSVLKLFKCHQCVYTTNSFSNLQVHFSVHTGEKPFKCQECDKSFKTSSHLKRHSVLHWWKPHKCERCHFISSTVEELKLHQERCNAEPERKRLRSSALKCDITEKHMNMAKGNKDTLKSQYLDSKNFKCEQCDYVTKKSSHLKHHKFRHHHLKLLTCGSCDFSTGNGQCFKKHMASHTNTKSPPCGHPQKQPALFVKVYKCEECDYITDRNGNLKIHLRTHTDERPHKCSCCSLAFRTSSHLNRHLATHLKWQCTKCKFSALNKQALEKHKQIHKEKKSHESHKEKKTLETKINRCAKCRLTFSTARLLELHQKKHSETKN